MWSQHGFWNNLDPMQSSTGAGAYVGAGASGYYPGYDQELASYYKHYGYDSGAFNQKHDTESSVRGNNEIF